MEEASVKAQVWLKEYCELYLRQPLFLFPLCVYPTLYLSHSSIHTYTSNPSV